VQLGVSIFFIAFQAADDYLEGFDYMFYFHVPFTSLW
jgi:hypothetical protein